jgi:hypothetical protein
MSFESRINADYFDVDMIKDAIINVSRSRASVCWDLRVLLCDRGFSRRAPTTNQHDSKNKSFLLQLLLFYFSPY